MPEFEPVIGLEVHTQLKTETKMFCSCKTSASEAPANAFICPVCTGQPGALPTPNLRAVRLGAAAGLALGCEVSEVSVFARKNYFYPDNPKAYQISQFDKPLCENGAVELDLKDAAGGVRTKTVRVHRAHLEEDAGKSLHAIGSRQLDHTLVDFNRCGVPLLEIVSEPDLNSADEAYAYLMELKKLLQWVGVSNCDMEKGELRCDVNISLRPKGETKLGRKVEIKNLNSFKAVKDAITHEIGRQAAVLNGGGAVDQDTRLWNEKEQKTVSMRSKELAHDYRYFPEPDLSPLRISAAFKEELKKEIGELPKAKKDRFKAEYGLSSYDAGVVTGGKGLSAYFEACMSEVKRSGLAVPAKNVLNLIASEFLARLNGLKKDSVTLDPGDKELISPANLAKTAALTAAGKLSASAAKTVFAKSWETGKDPETLMGELGLAQVSDAGLIKDWAREAIAANPKAAEDFRNGNEKALGPLVGVIMKKSKGTANPAAANAAIKELLK
ncbi:MAG: glutaminyl-tRNA synthase (glutamine-hydrolyzing) subunit B [Elusimicrobia bacterium GWA2_56_46]|nr:MAG: glutaminyl-tRNA synthase (glutamine-hydrolyzing) subunit B [Elusimicrobia bacterium GWA2_56_46]OGR53983.1 MAG: glutaminyl-tRNA synthase (glutamine-hydrolyzing) subunit B [Elusimicrobia bacterium GWC2_56_31]HBB65788.1 Asp-tRNA(Asn)/Glu-tRNA(Gln) amidotransferase GatCAB subunit B [Elusimicrobiota bacterium]HBW22092.1 Asp-tRNA(Asn)/Glu-tRNA(Gln) amidotransferase GatCAB subunit B [Elusimicrobiota bacterium]